MGYQCKKCDKKYKKKDYLREHIQIKHSKVQSLKCAKCDKHFVNKYSLKWRLCRVHPSKAKLHCCSFCGSNFKASWKYVDFIHVILIDYNILNYFFDNIEKTTTWSPHYFGSYYRKIFPLQNLPFKIVHSSFFKT
jgi:hypothetical protein